MTYQPNPTVSIGGTDYTGRTIESVQITRGRQTVYEEPRAGYAMIRIIDVDDNNLGFAVGADVQVTAETSAGSAVPLFTGRVSDWSASVEAALDGPVIRYSVTCVGPLAILNRRNVLAAGRPSEDDGARVAAAIGEGLPTPWDEYSATQTWAQAGQVTWDTVDPGYDPALIDPGVYTLTALGSATAGYSALNVVNDASLSAKGLLYETGDGFIGYADADRRPDNAAAGFLDIPYTSLAVGGLSLNSSLSDVTNRVTVTYGTADLSVTQQDDFSIGEYGLQETTLTTILADQSDAEARAEDLLFSQAQPSVEFDALTVNLRSNIGTALRDALLQVEANDAVNVTGLPEKVGFQTLGFRGFVEGITFRVSDFDATVSLFVSDENLSFGSVLWGQVGGTIVWNAVGTALTWADARRVTV
ncbi:MAG TPA: hypothetical protein VIG24_03435 [Acidimicrobiia bacterium]